MKGILICIIFVAFVTISTIACFGTQASTDDSDDDSSDGSSSDGSSSDGSNTVMGYIPVQFPVAPAVPVVGPVVTYGKKK